jgi:monooxygenase
VETAPEHFDVLIVGAGLSGIGAGCHLQRNCPGRSWAILEARGKIGGTWDLFRYPGVRADSDIFTLVYSFKPWKGAKAITDGPSILDYVKQAARESRVDEQIRFNHRAVRSEWCSEEARWTVHVERGATGERVEMTCNFLLMCTGYYRYDAGYAPEFPGRERFAGEVVHPQHWPEGLDCAGRRIAVIGSGATAVTLVPALAREAAHVTMVQRSPTYIAAVPARDPIADALRRRLPARAAHALVRWKNALLAQTVFRFSRRRPRAIKALLRRGLERRLPPGYDIDTHFTPRYNPWEQRLCLVPDGDFFAAIGSGRASIVTDRIETFTERGLRLASGAEVEADLIVTATGLDMLVLGGMELAVDGRGVAPGQTMMYKGMMLSGVPNLALSLGYTNASWTLKCELTWEYVRRLLEHMEQRGYAMCTPRSDLSVEALPFSDFSSGYIRRAIDRVPKQGARAPWRLRQNYLLDFFNVRFGRLEDGVLAFSRASAPVASAPPVAV